MHLLLATVPPRRACAERLLAALADQTVAPDAVHLCLEGYADLPSPCYPSGLTVREYRTAEASGPGARWRVLPEIPREAVVIVLDDDQQVIGRDVVEALVHAIDRGGAASCMGVDADGWGMCFPAGTELVAVAAGTMVARAADLEGLEGTRAEIRERCGFDPCGDGGDDEAVVSAHLWRRGVPMRAAGPIAVREAPGTQDGSQSERRRALRGDRHPSWQRREIRRATGWPWRDPGECG